MATKEAKVKTKEENDVIAEVNGLVIKKNSLYKVEHKFDRSAPDGFQKLGATKLPSEGIGNSTACKWEDRGNGQGRFDTGFYVGSACYRGMSPEEQKVIVASLNKNIVTPYETITKTGVLEVNNIEFWDNYFVDNYEGKVYNTENIDDLLALYISVRSYDLCPAGQEGSPAYSNCDYVIKDNAYSVSAAEKRNSEEFDAISAFGTMLTSAKPDLIVLLTYLNVIASNYKPTDTNLKSVFSLWLKKDIQNAENFLRLFAKSNTDEGMEEIQLFVKVKRLIEKKVIKKEGNEFLYNNAPLGVDVRSIVNSLTNDPQLADLKEEIRLL